MTMQCPSCSQNFVGEATVCQTCGAELAPVVSNKLIGTNLDGRYEILTWLSSTDESEIYKARHMMLDQLVAIRVLKAEISSDSQALQDFLQDARDLSALDRQQTTRVLDFGVTAQGRPYLVLKYTDDVQQLKDSGNIQLRISRSGPAIREMNARRKRLIGRSITFVVSILVLTGAIVLWVNSDSWRVFLLDVSGGGDLNPQSHDPALIPELKRNAQLYRRAGRFQLSEVIYNHLDEIAASNYGKDSLKRLAALEDLAYAAKLAGHSEKAKATYDDLMKGLTVHGWAEFEKQNYADATIHLARAEEIARSLDNAPSYVYILQIEGLLMMRQSKWQQADRFYERRLSALLAAGNKSELPMQYSSLASSKLQLHERDAALSYCDKAMRALESDKSITPQLRISVISSCAGIDFTLGKTDEAVRLMKEAIKIAHDTDTYSNDELPATYELLAQAYINQRHYEKALELLGDHMKFLEQTDRQHNRSLLGVYSCYGIAQDFCARAGNKSASFNIARRYYKEAINEGRKSIAAGGPSQAVVIEQVKALEAAEAHLPGKGHP